MKYRPRQDTIDAWKWDGTHAGYKHILSQQSGVPIGFGTGVGLMVPTRHNGVQYCGSGDFVVQHGNGDLSVIAAAEFNKLYEPVGNVPKAQEDPAPQAFAEPAGFVDPMADRYQGEFEAFRARLVELTKDDTDVAWVFDWPTDEHGKPFYGQPDEDGKPADHLFYIRWTTNIRGHEYSYQRAVTYEELQMEGLLEEVLRTMRNEMATHREMLAGMDEAADQDHLAAMVAMNTEEMPVPSEDNIEDVRRLIAHKFTSQQEKERLTKVLEELERKEREKGEQSNG